MAPRGGSRVMRAPIAVVAALGLLAAAAACSQSGSTTPAPTTIPPTTAATGIPSTPAPTAISPTPAATAIPSTPVPTAIPATPGPVVLEKFDSRFVELWLPDTFVGGDPKSVDLEALAGEIDGLNPTAIQVARLVEKLPHVYSMLAIDTNVGEHDIPNMVFVVRDYNREEFVLQDMVDSEVSHQTGYMVLVSSEIIPVGSYEAHRFVLQELSIEMPTSKQVVYSFKDGNNVWSVNFTTSSEEYDLRSPGFEEGMLSFNIKPEAQR